MLPVCADLGREKSTAGANCTGIVLLQAMKDEPPLDAKCRDKFLVQSVEITPDKEFVDSPSNVQYLRYLLYGDFPLIDLH